MRGITEAQIGQVNGPKDRGHSEADSPLRPSPAPLSALTAEVFRVQRRAVGKTKENNV